MTEPRITTEGPVDVEGGYMEFRVNWTAEQLLAMTPEEFARFKASMGALQQLSQPRPPIVVEDEAGGGADAPPAGERSGKASTGARGAPRRSATYRGQARDRTRRRHPLLRRVP